MSKYIILDRDGVINFDSDDYIKSPAEWLPIPGSLEAIVKLKQVGYQIAVATNQSGIARKLYDEATLMQIHQKMQQMLADLGAQIDVIFYCPHKTADHCACRKPKPGMLYQAAKHFNIDLTGILYIGDKKVDVDAANAAGCQPILVKTGYGQQTLLMHPHLNVPVYNNLAEAVDSILQGSLRNESQ